MIRAVLFDLDGTLLDTAPDLVAALNRVRDDEALPPLPVADYRFAAGRGAAGLVAHGLPPGSAEQTEQRKDKFLHYYQKDIYRDSQPFEGIPALLDWLSGQGIPWGVVTNKAERFALPVMQHAGISDAAGCVVCGDTLRTSKPHPAPMRLACELLGAAIEDTLMVGDDLRDLQAADAVGCESAFVHWGYGELPENPDSRWHRFHEVDSFHNWLQAGTPD